MPRKPRIEHEGAIYHVMSRGDRQEAIYRDDADRNLFPIEFIGKDLAVVGYHCRDGLRVARIGIDWFYER